MISFHLLPDLRAIADLKAAYLASLLAPMDDMWETGFTNSAPHWEIQIDGTRTGYYAANEDGTLLQFYVLPEFAHEERRIFQHVISQDSVLDAVVSTIDPTFLALCLDVQKSVTVHTYLYQAGISTLPFHPDADRVRFRSLEPHELNETVSFQLTGLGGDENLRGWLEGYSENLIQRRELFVLCDADEWIGLGERRISDTQPGVCHLGMIVSPNHRRKGWATYIFQLLAEKAAEGGKQPVCSTTTDNPGAQKAIERAGFINRHRIMGISL